MPIENRNLKPGTKLSARYNGQECTAEVVEGEDGVRYRLDDGRAFRSPSAAGSTVMDGKACNGWRFWSLGDGERSKPKKTAKKAGRAGDGLLSRLDDGRWFCSACMEAFDVPRDVESQGCPKGHRPEGPDA